MNPTRHRGGPCLAVLLLLIIAAALGWFSRGSSQTSINLRFTPTLSVTGAIGSWQQIQYSDDLADATNWTMLTNLLLTQTPTSYTDLGSVQPHRFYRAVTITNLGDTNLVWIPPGTFLIGSPSNEFARRDFEGPQTLVTLTSGFFMGRFEVTQLEYLSTVGSYPAGFLAAHAPTNNTFPMDYVSPDEATNYCALLTSRDLAAWRIPAGWVYRLPTEAEWEYACRAGSTNVFNFGNAIYNSTNQGSLANFDGHYPYPPVSTTDSTISDPTGIFLGRPVSVGSYSPNAFGLYDMHGNVKEWCLDMYNPNVAPSNYPGGSITNPVVFAGAGRITRGGGWAGFGVPATPQVAAGARCRSAWRFAELLSPLSLLAHGFRVVLVPSTP